MGEHSYQKQAMIRFMTIREILRTVQCSVFGNLSDRFQLTLSSLLCEMTNYSIRWTTARLHSEMSHPFQLES